MPSRELGFFSYEGKNKAIMCRLPFGNNRGLAAAGTEGAELYAGLDIVSEHIFDKLLGDALTNKELLAMVREKGYDELHICGLDEFGCVTSTALGAAKRGITAKIVRSGTVSVFPEKKQKKGREKLAEAGVEYI